MLKGQTWMKISFPRNEEIEQKETITNNNNNNNNSSGEYECLTDVWRTIQKNLLFLIFLKTLGSFI